MMSPRKEQKHFHITDDTIQAEISLHHFLSRCISLFFGIHCI